jgi:TRAP-type uncharacterized transport system fused permease subunit
MVVGFPRTVGEAQGRLLTGNRREAEVAVEPSLEEYVRRMEARLLIIQSYIGWLLFLAVIGVIAGVISGFVVGNYLSDLVDSSSEGYWP